MKRIILIIILIIIYCFIIIEKSKGVFAEKINLNLDDNEIGIIIYNNEEDFLMFKENNRSTLFVINMVNRVKIRNFLDVFAIDKIDNLIVYPNIDIKIDSENKYYVNEKIDLENIKFERYDNILKINIYDYNLCIYNAGNNNNIDDCTFTYFKDIDDKLKITDKNKVVFYNENIGEKFQEKLYTKWIDNYSLSKDVYTVLKVKKDNYNIINIPIQ